MAIAVVTVTLPHSLGWCNRPSASMANGGWPAAAPLGGCGSHRTVVHHPSLHQRAGVAKRPACRGRATLDMSGLPQAGLLDGGLDVTRLAWNLWLDECGKLRERLLPAEVAHLKGNDFRYSFLHYVDLGAAGNLRQSHCHLNSPG